MPKFVPGLKLCKLFYIKEVKPILDREFPGLKYSAAVIGWGSEVLGFDTEISRDHHWGPRVLLFLGEKDYPKLQKRISKALADNLPYEFMGYSTNYSKPDSNGVRHEIKIKRGPVDHMVNIYMLKSFFNARLKFDPTKKITPANWLGTPQQRLLEVVSGEVYHDGLNDLQKVRQKLHYYPKDIWLYLLACQWIKISNEEAFVGRTGEVGDELGSQLIAARIARELMIIAFLMEKQYVPYSKWFGTGFKRLKIAKKLSSVLRQALSAKNWKSREKWMSKAYAIIAQRHNALKITKPLPAKVSNYHGRSYLVIHSDLFGEEIMKAIKDIKVKKMKTDIKSIDELTAAIYR